MFRRRHISPISSLSCYPRRWVSFPLHFQDVSSPWRLPYFIIAVLFLPLGVLSALFRKRSGLTVSYSFFRVHRFVFAFSFVAAIFLSPWRSRCFIITVSSSPLRLLSASFPRRFIYAVSYLPTRICHFILVVSSLLPHSFRFILASESPRRFVPRTFVPAVSYSPVSIYRFIITVSFSLCHSCRCILPVAASSFVQRAFLSWSCPPSRLHQAFLS